MEQQVHMYSLKTYQLYEKMTESMNDHISRGWFIKSVDIIPETKDTYAQVLVVYERHDNTDNNDKIIKL